MEFSMVWAKKESLNTTQLSKKWKIYWSVCSPSSAMKHIELFLTQSSSNFMSPNTPVNPMNLYRSKNVFVVNSTQSNNCH